MPDYKFTFHKQIDLVIEAATEHEAWMQANAIDPSMLAVAEWDVRLNETFTASPPPIDQGPVEIDDWPAPDPQDLL
jgi:hypothetical protein